MKIKITLLIITLIFAVSVFPQKEKQYHTKNKAGSKRPTLIVLIADDGLGVDIFTRYDSLFKGGFRRLKDNGMNFENAMVNHALTISHLAHVTLSTGMNPSHHGIKANRQKRFLPQI